MERHPSKGGNGQHGMNWIRPAKRLAIYLRDGLACSWCGLGVEDGIKLTLDHLTTRQHGGSNHETNLITACLGCNSKRKQYSVRVFAWQLSRAMDGALSPGDMVDHIRQAVRRPLDVAAAEELIRARGGFGRAVYGNRRKAS